MEFAYKKLAATKTLSDPIEIYKIFRSKNSFLLQSGNKNHWSFIGFDPLKIIKDNNKNSNSEKTLQNLYKKFANFQIKPQKNFPPFYGGLAGFFSYDFGVKFENIKQSVKNDLNCPEIYFGIYDKIICLDHKKNTLWLFAWDKNKEIAVKKVQTILSKIKTPSSKKANPYGQFMNCPYPSIHSNLTKSAYTQKIKKIKEYLTLGHTYQVNFSQRFETYTDLDPFQIYQNFTILNPSEFQAYFENSDFTVMSNSPERLAQVYYDFKTKKYLIQTTPIKGTIARGKMQKEDEKNKLILLNSEKDKAELMMIVDLSRNDIGKVCQEGTVKVIKHRYLKAYSHIWHTMSDIRGVLKKEKNFTDIIKALLPGASITGCPKKRTMEIINELEDFKRGVYCGSAGYINFDGQMDFNIMIRTMFYNPLPLTKGKARRECNQKNNEQKHSISDPSNLFFHSGGGIVIDSTAKSEYKETLAKAKTLKKSLNLI